MDELYKQLVDHEKGEITIQATKKRMTELKQKIQQLEYKEKWNWKTLVKKREVIEGEKVDLKKRLNSQTRQNHNRIQSQTRINEELEKKINIMATELESAQFQKQILKDKVKELTQHQQSHASSKDVAYCYGNTFISNTSMS